MNSSAHVSMTENNSKHNDTEFKRLIQVYNQKLVREKLDKYSLDFVKLDSDDFTVKISVIRDQETSARSSNESVFSSEVPRSVENIYRTKLLKEFRKRKTFLKDVNIN